MNTTPTNNEITNDQGETREEGIRRLTRDMMAGRGSEALPASPVWDPAGDQDIKDARSYAQAQIALCLRDLEKALADGDLDKANLEASTALIAGAPRGKVEDLMVRYGA